jgi:hypothetical protein
MLSLSINSKFLINRRIDYVGSKFSFLLLNNWVLIELYFMAILQISSFKARWRFFIT